ncbi:MAG TPA: hypothetical protein VKP69_00770, partial [Isosphaeraceae bacterium]|nr:hypothetical protein [Isosphaeraceae bacterium]
AADSKAQEAKLLATVQEALERNARELQALKEQYATDMEQQRRRAEAQQKQIEALERHARELEGRLQQQAAPKDEAERLQKLSELQQKQIDVVEQQARLLADQVKKQGPAVEKLQAETATLASRSKQAALRDVELANAQDALLERWDLQQRNPPRLPAPLKQWFLPSGTNVTPFSVWNTVSTRYDIFQNQRGAGKFAFEEYTPFFLVQLNKRFLLSAETTFNQSGVSLGQAQIDAFVTDWLTVDVGYFLSPIGFWNERLDPRWINKLPDVPLVMQQVIPDGLTTTGVQFRGARYLFRSPVKMEYSLAATNGLGVPGMGKAADWNDLGGVIGTTANVNSAAAYTERLGLWIPSRGINFGVSEFVNAPYSAQSGAVISVWQPYFNYHRGNWDFRFEYGNMYERTKPFIGNNIRREGLYAQVAYRDYRSIRKHLQRMEYVFRFSDAYFHGIDQAKIDPTAFDSPMAAPVNRNQYTIGFNYYLYASSIVKFAYELNQEVGGSFHDNVFMVQFATNF